jgi:hypothetical protein
VKCAILHSGRRNNILHNLMSNYMQFETQVSCLVVGKVTENLPFSGFNPVNLPENIQLADPLGLESSVYWE